MINLDFMPSRQLALYAARLFLTRSLAVLVMGWDMVLVADACDCFDLPDGNGCTIPAETVQAAHVATLGYEFCKVVSTSDLV